MGQAGNFASSSYPSNLAASLNLAGLNLQSPSNHPFATSSSLITGLDLSTHNVHNPLGFIDPLLLEGNNIAPGQPLPRGVTMNGVGVASMRGATASLPNLGIVNGMDTNLTPGSSGLLSGLSLPTGATDFISGLTNSITSGFPNLNHLPTIITTNFDKEGTQHFVYARSSAYLFFFI